MTLVALPRTHIPCDSRGRVFMRRDDDCMLAAMASLAGIAYEDAPQVVLEGSREAWDAWAAERGLRLNTHQWWALPTHRNRWVALVVVPSTGRKHAVVMERHRIVHDPIPYRDEEHMALLATSETTNGYTLDPAGDEFDQAAGNLTGKTAPVGGVWAGAGDADDFQVETTGKTLQRSVGGDAGTESGRYAISGVAAFAAQVVQIDVTNTGWTNQWQGLLSRYVDVNNWFRLVVMDDVPGMVLLRASKRVAGTVTVLGEVAMAKRPIGSWDTLRSRIDEAGRWVAWMHPRGAPGGDPDLSGQDPVFATGGTLASGKPGIHDMLINAVGMPTRSYDNFIAFAPTSDGVLYANRKLEVRALGDDVVLRQDAAGTYYGVPPEARSGRFWLPAGGPSRVVVKARRNDVETFPDDQIADGVKLQVAYRARWVNFPRSP